MSDPSKSGNGGWFSAVGRLFGGKSESDKSASQPGVASESSVSNNVRSVRKLDSKLLSDHTSQQNGPQINNSRPGEVRHLSPSALLGRSSTAMPPPVRDVFNSPAAISTSTRKRQLADDRPAASTLDEMLLGDSSKRFCGVTGHSLLEEPKRSRLTSDRMDMTWGGGFTSFGMTSPASRSLISRVSNAHSTTSSGLSSKTRAILQQLDKISTPGKDTRKLPMMRVGGAHAEKWSVFPSNGGGNISITGDNSFGAPPLRRMSAVPSRIQLLSTSMSAQRKPYWRDLYRDSRAAEEKRSSKPSTSTDASAPTTSNGDGSLPSSNNVCALFDLSDGAASSTVSKSVSIQAEPNKRKHQSVVKGVDGKSTKQRNTFNANNIDLDDEEDDVESQTAYKALSSVTAPRITAGPPAGGFLNDLVFSFDAPTTIIPGMKKDSDADSSDDDDSSNEDEVGNSSSDSDDSESSVADKTEPGSEKTETNKSSRPPTAANSNSETSAEVTPAQSQNVSPQSQSKWSCPDCFIDNDATVTNCIACGHNKNGGSSSTTLVSASSFAAKNTVASGISFGLGSSSKTSDSINKAASSSTFAPPSSFSSTIPTIVEPPVAAEATKTATASGENRSAWDCPECFVSAAATDDKCKCCGYVKYKSTTDDSKPANVFGDRAIGAIKPATSSAFSFGIGSSTTKKDDTAATSAASVPTVSREEPPKSSGFSLNSTATLFGAASKPPLGTSKSKETPSLFSSSSAAPVLGLTSSSTSNTTAQPSLSATLNVPIFGNLAPATSSASSTNLIGNVPMFSNTTAITSEPTKPIIFGAPTKTSNITTKPSVFGSSSTETLKPPLFGSLPSAESNKSIFNPSSSALPTEAVKPFAFSGGQSVATSTAGEGSKTSLFSGESSSSTSLLAPSAIDTTKAAAFPLSSTDAPKANIFGTGSKTGSGLFGAAKPEGSSLFGSSSAGAVPTPSAQSSFGSSISSSSSVFGASSSNKSSFLGGGEASKAASLFAPKPNLFGSSGAPSLTAEARPEKRSAFQIGGSSTDGAAPFKFGSASLAAPSAAPSSNGFGGFNALAAPTTSAAPAASSMFNSNSTPMFGNSFANQSGSLSSSSSTNSLNTAGAGGEFKFSSQVPSIGSFQFGGSGSTLSGGQPFVFQTNAAAAAPQPSGAFNFGAQPQAQLPTFNMNDSSAPSGAFAYSSMGSSSAATDARKKLMAARRRPVRRP